jgi:hypothetical protein
MTSIAGVLTGWFQQVVYCPAAAARAKSTATHGNPTFELDITQVQAKQR